MAIHYIPPPQPDEKPRILIVDNSRTNVQVMANILRNDYEILTAYSGEEAMKMALEEKPDLVLLDVMMPNMDGFEVCRRLKQEPKTRHTPVIFVTALDEVQNEARGFEFGAVDYLTKPISKPIVRARVRNHIELKRHRDFLEKLSTLDGLTSIPNRRHYEVYFDQEWRGAIRNETPISLLMIDIDCFKKFNDRYGHLEGDDCLKEVAICLADSIRRPGDFVARYGGEEFCSVLPNTDLDGAMMLGEAMRAAVEGLAIPHEENASCGHVTVSIGLASVTPKRGQSSNMLKRIADDLLYQAKSEGRNRVLGKALKK